MPIFEAFAAKTDPTYKISDKGHGSGRYTEWITRAYAQRAAEGKPLKSEDLYKIHDELVYFEKAKAAIKQSGKSTNINDYQTYRDFSRTVTPMMLRHENKKQRGKGMPDAVRDETTILYDGPEGKVVMPHTVRASQFWGQATKWCISERHSEDAYWGEDEDGNIIEIEPDPNTPNHAFHIYYKKSPVIMYVPKGKALSGYDVVSGKVAVVDGDIYNEKDDTVDALPEYVRKLRKASLQAAHAHSSQEAYDYIERYGDAPANGRKAASGPQKPTITHHFEHLPADQQDVLNRIQLKELSIKGSLTEHPRMWKSAPFVKAMITVNAEAIDMLDETIKSNSRFAGAAVALNGLSLQYLPRRIKENADIVMAALEQNGLAMQSALPQFKEDVTYVLAAVRQNPQALAFAAPGMSTNNLAVAKTIVECDPANMKMIDSSFFEDQEFVVHAIDTARAADGERRLVIIAQLHRIPDLWGHVTGDLEAMAQKISALNAEEPVPPRELVKPVRNAALAPA